MTTSAPPDPRLDDRTISFTLNEQAATVGADDSRSLLSILREDFGLISLKNGCEPQASCGCCLLLVDGQPRLSCTMKPRQVAGKELITLEGLPEKIRTMIADSFVQSGGVQCGFCIPGMAMRAHAIVETNPSPTRPLIAHELRAHLCRCTGYVKIVDAIEDYARCRRGEGSCYRDDASGRIGTPLARHRGRELVLGDFKYIDDLTPVDLSVKGEMISPCATLQCGQTRSADTLTAFLYAAMKFSDHPRALVRGIDTSKAMKLPGVHRVITAADVPGDRYVGLIVNDWPILVAVGEETRCVGDMLAMVVADDQYIARRAAELIEVEYEVREPVTTPEEGLKPEAPEDSSWGEPALALGDFARRRRAGTGRISRTWWKTRFPLSASSTCSWSRKAASPCRR